MAHLCWGSQPISFPWSSARVLQKMPWHLTVCGASIRDRQQSILFLQSLSVWPAYLSELWKAAGLGSILCAIFEKAVP